MMSMTGINFRKYYATSKDSKFLEENKCQVMHL